MILSKNELIYLYRYRSFASMYWGTKGAGVLPVCKTTGRLLLGLRSPYVNEPNTWGVIGGKFDEGDTNSREVAKREFLEETNYKGKLQLIPAYKFVDKNTFEYQNFIGVVDKEFETKSDWETKEFRWMNFDEVLKLTNKHFGLESLLNDSSSKRKIQEIVLKKLEANIEKNEDYEYPLKKCFRNAVEFARKASLKGINAKIIHGTLYTNGLKRINHAWVEVNDLVYDPTFDKKEPKELYYKNFNVNKEDEFDLDRLEYLLSSTGHYGPYTSMEKIN